MEIIKTDKSALVIHDANKDILSLIEECVPKIDSVLDYHPQIIIYGKVAYQQRSVGFFSIEPKCFNYSHTKTQSKSMPECLCKLLHIINAKFKSDFDGILINKYISGEEYIGKHSDDNAGSGVVVLSYGAVRKFRIRDKLTNKIVMDVKTYPDKMIQMAGNFQREFTHEIPVEKRVKDIRYSFTFRKHG